jgi:hypothetical protein
MLLPDPNQLERIMRIAFIAAITCLALVASGQSLAGGKSGGKSSRGKNSKSAGSDYRSAKSGQYVKKNYADKNKSTTVKEARKD